MAAKLPFKKKIGILFEHGREKGLPLAYRQVEARTGISYNNLMKMYNGGNENPQYETLQSLAKYFGTTIAYFDCQSVKDCREFLEGVRAQADLEGIAARAEGLPAKSRRAVMEYIDMLRKAEGID